MKILLINKYHYLRGGAERAYFDTAQILREAGHEVAFFSMQHPKNEPTPWGEYFVEGVEYGDEHYGWWQKLKIVCKIVWNFEAQKRLEQLIRAFQPDVAHVHNIYHQLSPSLLWTLKKHKIPTVMTLHDYKLVCPNYNLFAQGKIWERSKPRKFYRCAADACVKDSRLKSLVCTAEAYVHQWLGSYALVDKFIAPSRFLIKKFQEFEFPHLIEYVPQPLVPFPQVTDQEKLVKSDAPFVFVGRLSEEKGADVALRAFARSQGASLFWVVGSGPAEQQLRQLAEELKVEERVRFWGAQYGEDLEKIFRQAKAMVVPSVWYENMPYVVLETMARGKVVIASDIGGIGERIQDGVNGFLFPAGDVARLAECFAQVEKMDTAQLGRAAREMVADLQPEAYLKCLMEVYDQVQRG
jgi:glycosyltransferase involved in cell wall biosynthesis